MPSKSINLDVRHLSYLQEYANKNGMSESEAARKLLDLAMEASGDA